jgi:NADPH:quinone reductase-like Zn-dependent oxidoreductase
MNAATIIARGTPVTPNIRVVHDWPEPSAPARGECRVKVLCSALNHMDLWVGMGVPGLELTYPRVSGCDVCGVVEDVGEGVDKSWLGRQVVMNAAVPQPEQSHPSDPSDHHLAPNYQLIGEHHNGGHCARLNIPVAQLVDAEDLNPVTAAAFGLVTLTAWSMMFTKGQLRPGQRVLITGIGGGVATSALAIARWLGCPVAVTSRHQWKLDRAAELGAELCILDQGQDWSSEVRAWSHRRGVDMAVDSVGRPTHMNCIKSLARGGAFVTPGNTGGPRVETDQARLFWNQLRLLGSTMGSISEMREIIALLRAGHLSPVIDSVIPWTDAPLAWKRLEGQDQFGKIVLDWR